MIPKFSLPTGIMECPTAHILFRMMNWKKTDWMLCRLASTYCWGRTWSLLFLKTQHKSVQRLLFAKAKDSRCWNWFRQVGCRSCSGIFKCASYWNRHFPNSTHKHPHKCRIHRDGPNGRTSVQYRQHGSGTVKVACFFMAILMAESSTLGLPSQTGPNS